MKDILLDTLIDGIKLAPFLFIAFLIIELVEHKFSDKTETLITKSGKFGPILGSILGAVPQCGFGVLSTNLYVTRIISLGTLISIYLSTSDEMIPILLSHQVPLVEIAKIIAIKVVIGMIFGFLIDFIYQKKNKKDYHICDEDDCDCEDSLLKSSLIHTFKTLAFILIITFIINYMFTYLDETVIEKIFMKNSIFAPFIASLIGLIPNCGASVAITELYLNNVITYGTCIGGLLTGNGISILILFKSNKNLKENILILILVLFIGIFIGTLLNIFAL